MISSRHSPHAPRKLLHPHVVDDQQIGLEIPIQGFVLLAQVLVAQEVAGQIEDGAVQHQEAGLDGLMPDGLNQKRLADAGWTQQQHIGFLADELAAGQVVDLLALDGRVEGEVELVEVFDFAETWRP